MFRRARPTRAAALRMKGSRSIVSPAALRRRLKNSVAKGGIAKVASPPASKTLDLYR